MINFHFHIERWKKNKELNIYVSTDGRVKNSNKQILKQRISTGTGYFVVKIGNYWKNVHSLVIETWRKKQENMTIDHIDSNKRNNRLSNLEYVSYEENLSRAKNITVDVEQKELTEPPILAANENDWFISFANKFPNRINGLSADIAIPRIRKAASQHKKYLGFLLKRYPDGRIEGIMV